MSGVPHSSLILSDLLNAQPGGIIRLPSNMLGGGPQQQTLNSLAQYQQQMQLSSLSAQQLSALSAYHHPIDPEMQRYRDMAHNEWARGRAKEYTDKGERLIDQIAFWRAWYPVSAPILHHLSRKLDVASANAERYAAMIRPEKEPAEQ